KFSGDGLNPTVDPSNFFAFDFKGKSARSDFLRVQRLSLSIGRFLKSADDRMHPSHHRKKIVSLIAGNLALRTSAALLGSVRPTSEEARVRNAAATPRTQ